MGVKVGDFAESAQAAMLGYNWPGNVRELQNTIERAVILSEPGRPVSAAALGLNNGGHIEAGRQLLEALGEPPTLPVDSPAGPAAAPVRSIAELEKEAILSAMENTGGDRQRTAELLGISIRTLRNKLNEYRGGSEACATAGGSE
jgi:DNA-binding NtrC family response regulator